MYGGHNVECLRTRENLANCLRNLEKFDEAEQHYTFLLEECSIPWFSLRNNCALFYWARGYFSNAYNILTTLLTNFQSIYGDLHHETLATQHNIGTLCLDMGYYGEARRHLHQAFKGRQKLFGWIHPQTLMSARNLATAEVKLKYYNMAGKLLKKALKMARLYRPKEEDISFDLVGLMSMVAAGRWQWGQAQLLLRESFTQSAVHRGSDNPKTLQIAHTLAGVVEMGAASRDSDSTPRSYSDGNHPGTSHSGDKILDEQQMPRHVHRS